jgi:tellurium resistance protein TerD
MSDILDTSFEGKDVKLSDHRVELGDDINISAKDKAMTQIVAAVGWDSNSFDSTAIDADISVFLLGKDDMTRNDEDFVFYNNMQSSCEGVRHEGDNRTGIGEGDDETIFIDLQKLPFDVMRVVFVLSIYKGLEREHLLGMVRKSYIRLVNAHNNHELLRYELSEDLNENRDTAAIIGSLNREGPKWHFTPLNESFNGGLGEVATKYGMIITKQ